MRILLPIVCCLSAVACAAPSRVVSLPHDGAGAFVYEVPPVRFQPRHGISVAVVRPDSEVRPARSAGPGGDLGWGRAAMGEAAARSRVPGAGTAIRAERSARRNVALKTEAEVEERIHALLEEFLEAARRDYGLILMGKGLDTAGSFRVLTDMTFSEKREATFALVSKFRFELEKSVDHEPTLLSSVSGRADLGAECDVFLVEALSGEKLWSRHFVFAPQSVPFTIRERQTLSMEMAMEDPRPEAVGQALRAVYREAMDRLSQSIDADAWGALEADALTLKRRASPVMH